MWCARVALLVLVTRVLPSVTEGLSGFQLDPPLSKEEPNNNFQLIGHSGNGKRATVNQSGNKGQDPPAPYDGGERIKKLTPQRPLKWNADDRYYARYYDSYGDWHGHHDGSPSAWITSTGGHHQHHPHHGTDDHNNWPDRHPYGGGYKYNHALLSLQLLMNPLVLLGTLSFVVCLINAVLGLAERVKLPAVRTVRETITSDHHQQQQQAQDKRLLLEQLYNRFLGTGAFDDPE